jgi:hypothetical protein
MDLAKIFEDKNITPSTQNLYIKNLTRLSGGEIKNINFLKDENEILEKLKKYQPNTQRTYIISIVSLLKSLSTSDPKKYKKLYDKYFLLLDGMNNNLKTNNEKSTKEKENWISQDEVLSRLEELKKILPTLGKKINEEQFKELQKLLLLGLYALQKPRRNKDYQDCLVIRKMNELNQPYTSNLLILPLNKFVFQNYKTGGTYKTQEIDIDPELREIIDTYLKYHPLIKKTKEAFPFLVDYNGIPYTNNNDITRLLYKVFNKKIGVNLLRHIFLTDKYKTVIDEMKEDATKMGTSTGMIENQYIKN